MRLQVEVFSQAKYSTPPLLVPRRLDHVAPEQAVLRAQLFGVAGKHPSPRRIAGPDPHREKHGDEQRFHGPRRDVKDDAFHLRAADLFEAVLFDQRQVFADQLQVPVPAQFGDGLKDGPRAANERLKAIAQLLRVGLYPERRQQLTQ